MTKDKRLRVRNPDLIRDLAARFRQAQGYAGDNQLALTAEFSTRAETISRLFGGSSISISLDVLVNLSRWAAAKGISLEWLFTGNGEMLAARLDSPQQASTLADELLAELNRSTPGVVESAFRAIMHRRYGSSTASTNEAGQ